MPTLLVLKFGGTSVGSAAAIRQSASVIQDAQKKWDQVAVVISALSGVTNALLDGARLALEGDDAAYLALAEQLNRRHKEVIQDLLPDTQQQEEILAIIAVYLDEFRQLCHAISVIREAPARALDAISSLGERMAIPIMAAFLRTQGTKSEAVSTTTIVRTDSVFQSANPDWEITRQQAQRHLVPMLQEGVVPVLTGFIGSDIKGTTTTLGRGGSDFSGAIIAAVLDADDLWIMTDVNGVMTGDPRVVSNARTLPVITYREVAELAFYGAKVLHPKTVHPVVGTKTNLWVKNTFDPYGESTHIVSDDDTSAEKTPLVIRAVTAIKNQSIVTVEGRGMMGVQGIAGRTFQATARSHANVSIIVQASSEQSICFTVPASDSKAVVESLRAEFEYELKRQDISSINAQNDAAIVTVVGDDMKNRPGAAGRVFGALGQSGVNVVAIAQGSSECSISFVVDAAHSDKAVNAIHALIVSR